MRRFTGLTSAFSKKFENRRHVLVLYFFFYNFRVHRTLDVERARGAGVVDRILKMEDCISVIDARRALKPPGPESGGDAFARWGEQGSRPRLFSVSSLHAPLL
jgi:hypothetical protein